jgi:hypothetical protein
MIVALICTFVLVYVSIGLVLNTIVALIKEVPLSISIHTLVIASCVTYLVAWSVT